MDFLIGTFLTLFVIIDPPGLVPIFIGLTQRSDAAGRRRIALKSCLISLVVLLSFAFIGDFILDGLKISVPSFRIAGGLLLLLAAINMVMGHTDTPKNETESKGRIHDDVAVFPLAIPLIAGPGSLVTVVLLMRELTNNYMMQAGIVGVLVLILATTYVCLRLSEPILKIIGPTGGNVLTRVLGIILAALAIQFIVDGALGLTDLFTGNKESHFLLKGNPLFLFE